MGIEGFEYGYILGIQYETLRTLKCTFKSSILKIFLLRFLKKWS